MLVTLHSFCLTTGKTRSMEGCLHNLLFTLRFIGVVFLYNIEFRVWKYQSFGVRSTASWWILDGHSVHFCNKCNDTSRVFAISQWDNIDNFQTLKEIRCRWRFLTLYWSAAQQQILLGVSSVSVQAFAREHLCVSNARSCPFSVIR